MVACRLATMGRVNGSSKGKCDAPPNTHPSKMYVRFHMHVVMKKTECDLSILGGCRFSQYSTLKLVWSPIDIRITTLALDKYVPLVNTVENAFTTLLGV